MNNKYYTPKIEEFYIGFEFELYYKLSIKELYVWGETILLQTPDLQLIPGKIRNKTIRVKYLDIEDIKSFGFNLLEDEDLREYAMYKFSRKDFNLSFINLNWNKDPYLFNNILISRDEDVRFKGIIRNKSELKRILKQVGVLEYD